MTVAGVDGTRGGWVVVTVDDGGVLDTDLVDRISALPAVGVVAIDIPLGFPEPGATRPSEVAARRRVPGRASSVFSTPPRIVLEAPDYREACARASSLIGRAISQQSWALRHRILEAVDAERSGRPLIEVHPEVVFSSLADGEPLAGKRTWNGMGQRRRLLGAVGLRLPNVLGPAGEAAPDDVVDAAACAWVGLRFARGEAVRIAPPAGPDDRSIWV